PHRSQSSAWSSHRCGSAAGRERGWPRPCPSSPPSGWPAPRDPLARLRSNGTVDRAAGSERRDEDRVERQTHWISRYPNRRQVTKCSETRSGQGAATPALDRRLDISGASRVRYIETDRQDLCAKGT